MRACIGALACSAAYFLGPSGWAATPVDVGHLQNEIATVQVNLDHVWIMVAAGLVFLMQVGFMLLEGGLVRSKNSINVAQKNLADFTWSFASFGALGFMVMFGPSVAGLFGFDTGLMAFDQLDERTYAFFVFQGVFCGTAATILSGAIAERMHLSAYLIMIPIIAVVIYPVFGHWAWGNLLLEDNTAFLADWGFVDFAGSTVVHSVGAWIGLAALLIIGPRIGRFDESGKPVRIHGHSTVLATVGAFLLWIGWIGFNGGSTLSGTAAFSHIVANTMVAGGLGGAMALPWGRWVDGHFRPDRMINGVLGGLVAVTAGCDVVSTWGAATLGITGGLIAVFGQDLLEKLGIDDAVGAVPVHGFAGAWGTIALALLAPLDSLPLDSRFDQLLVQTGGVALAFVWAFGAAYVALKTIDTFLHLRISEEDELAGLNQSEHGATLGTGELQKALAQLVAGNADLSQRVNVESGDESAELATLFNRLMANLEADQVRQQFLDKQHRDREAQHRADEQTRVQQELQEREQERKIVGEISQLIELAAEGDLRQRLSLQGKTGALGTVSQGINQLLDHLSVTITGIGKVVAQIEEATSQVRDGSRGLAERSGAQRQAIVETSTDMTQIAEILSVSASEAKEARHQADETSGIATASADTADRAIHAMHEIERSTTRIGEVVEMINEIAFQTNILALNASVEAARAGGAGGAFAIVAQEVQSLASRTKSFADEIGAIADESQQTIATGKTVVAETSDALGEIRGIASSAAGRIAEIHQSAVRQTVQIESLVQAIQRISALSEDNATLSQDSATSAASLREQTRQLKELVNIFAVDDRSSLKQAALHGTNAVGRELQTAR